MFHKGTKAKKGSLTAKKQKPQKLIASGQAETEGKAKDRGCKKSESTYNRLFNAMKMAYVFRKKPAAKGVSIIIEFKTMAVFRKSMKNTSCICTQNM